VADEKTKLKFALALALRGLYIAPLQPESKIPYSGESWSQMRSRDPKQIREWFLQRPGMNYAVVPGENFVVLDLDVKKGKDGIGDLEYIAAMADDFTGSHTETMTIRTPSVNEAGQHGEHRVFKSPWPVSVAHTLPKSIDVRGNDGYIVGPGCSTERDPITGTFKGEYEFKNSNDIGPLPEWLEPRLQRWVPREDRPSYEDSVELIDGRAFVDGVELDTPQLIERATEWLQSGAKPAVSGDGGNMTTYRTFAWLREHGISTHLSLTLVREHYNPRCIDKITGEVYPWETAELEQIRDNAYKYAKKGVSEAGGLMDRGLSDEEIVATSQDINELLAKYEQGNENAARQMRAEEIFLQQKVDDSLDAHTWTGQQALNYPAIKEFVCPNVLPAHGYVGFLAKRGTGKTTVMMDMALRLAHDMDWHGKPMKMGWGALFLAGEDPEGAKDQIRAWMAMHEIVELSDRFVFMDAITNLLSPESVSKWTPHFRKISAERRFAVFADTWQIATAGGSQNDDEVMQVAIMNAKRIGREVRGPAIMAAHPPKGNEDTWSGAAVMENASQALWKLSSENHGMKFSVPRIKGTRAGYHAFFRFEPQMLGGSDEWGEPNSGIVPVKIGGEGHAAAVDELIREGKVRHEYACLIYKLMNLAEESEPDFIKKRQSAFSIIGTARRLIAAADRDQAEKLKELGENLTAIDPTKTRLTNLFRDSKKSELVDNVAGNAIRLHLHNKAGSNVYYFRTVAAKPEPDAEPQTLPDA
jgi:hypothetical protein